MGEEGCGLGRWRRARGGGFEGSRRPHDRYDATPLFAMAASRASHLTFLARPALRHVITALLTDPLHPRCPWRVVEATRGLRGGRRACAAHAIPGNKGCLLTSDACFPRLTRRRRRRHLPPPPRNSSDVIPLNTPHYSSNIT